MFEYIKDTSRPVICVNRDLIIINKNETARDSIPHMRLGMNTGRYVADGVTDIMKKAITDNRIQVIEIKTRSVYSRCALYPASFISSPESESREPAAYLLFSDFMNLCADEISCIFESTADSLNRELNGLAELRSLSLETASEAVFGTSSTVTAAHTKPSSKFQYARYYSKLVEFIKQYCIRNAGYSGCNDNLTLAVRNIVTAAAQLGTAYGYKIGFYSSGQVLRHFFNLNEFYYLFLMLISFAAKNSDDGIIAIEQKNDLLVQSSEITIHFNTKNQNSLKTTDFTSGLYRAYGDSIHEMDWRIVQYSAERCCFKLFTDRSFDGKMVITLSTETDSAGSEIRSSIYDGITDFDDTLLVESLAEELSTSDFIEKK